MCTIIIKTQDDLKKLLNEKGDIAIPANLNFINKIDIEIPGCIRTFSGWINTAGGSIKCEEIDTVYDDNDSSVIYNSGDIITCGGNIYVKSLQCGGRLDTGGGDVYVEKDLDLGGNIRTAGGKIICKGSINFSIRWGI